MIWGNRHIGFIFDLHNVFNNICGHVRLAGLSEFSLLVRLAVFSVTHQEQQVVVCQILQQQQQRELQRLTLSGALTSTPNSPKVVQSPSLLSSATASPKQPGQGGSLFGLQDNSLHKPGVSGHHRIPCCSSCVTKKKHEMLCHCFQAAGEKSGDKNG